MLVGYDKRETWERLFYRFNKMVEREIRPYPMVYGDRNRTLPLGGSNLKDRAPDPERVSALGDPQGLHLHPV
jgi:hypothetical protein